MPKFILLSGWACPGECLSPLSNELSKIGSVHALSIHELARLVPENNNLNFSHFFSSNIKTSSYSRYARHLIKIMKKINEPVNLIGWSTGGIITLEVATYFQELIDRIILVSTTAKFCADSEYEHGKPVSVLRAMSKGIRVDAKKVLANFFMEVDSPLGSDLSVIESRVRAAGRIGMHELQSGLSYLQNTDVRGSLKKVMNSTLVIHGKNDAVVPWQAGKYITDNVKNSSWILESDHGHDLPVRNPDFVAQHICNFMKGV